MNKKYKVRKDNIRTTITLNRIEDLFFVIFDFSGDEEAAQEVCAWAEKAEIGEVYEVKDFVIEVIRNDRYDCTGGEY